MNHKNTESSINKPDLKYCPKCKKRIWLFYTKEGHTSGIDAHFHRSCFREMQEIAKRLSEIE